MASHRSLEEELGTEGVTGRIGLPTLSTEHLVDTFSPQYMPFRYRAPGLADAGFLGKLLHGQPARPFVARQ
jgi:hypothetical protein